MDAVLIILSAALLALGVAGFVISSTLTSYRKRRGRLELLQRIVRCRYESAAEYTGDRSEFLHSISQIPERFDGSDRVLAAYRAFRDAEANQAGSAAAQHQLLQLLRAMCRDVQIDTAAVREELPLTSR